MKATSDEGRTDKAGAGSTVNVASTSHGPSKPSTVITLDCLNVCHPTLSGSVSLVAINSTAVPAFVAMVLSVPPVTATPANGRP